ncbi:hypothetical protein K1719_030675 [Acacia pycnantha]|nr:hypothetical protein K1719_030675 [Acacia pycnantha]
MLLKSSFYVDTERGGRNMSHGVRVTLGFSMKTRFERTLCLCMSCLMKSLTLVIQLWLADTRRLPPLEPSAIFAQRVKRKPGIAVTKSIIATEPGGKIREEIFVDVIEKISITFSSSLDRGSGELRLGGLGGVLGVDGGGGDAEDSNGGEVDGGETEGGLSEGGVGAAGGGDEGVVGGGAEGVVDDG